MQMLQHGQDRMQRKTSDLIDAALEENSRRRSRELSASLDGAQGQQRHQQRPGIRRRGSMEVSRAQATSSKICFTIGCRLNSVSGIRCIRFACCAA